jgi:hypothetical protein
MTPMSKPQAAKLSQPASRTHRRNKISALLLSLGLAAVYAANSRFLGSYDTEPTSLMLLTLARGEGVYLDRYRSFMRDTNRVLPVFVRPWRGHILSRYPTAPAILVQPCVIPQVLFLDWFRPGWDRDPRMAGQTCRQIARRSMAVLMSLAAVILYGLLISLGLRRVALPATLAAALGSNLWTVGSQAMWQHGPAAFSLMVVIALLRRMPVPWWRLILAGLATAFLFSCRLIDGLFAIVIVLWLARTQPKGLFWFLPVPLFGAVVLFSYNLGCFGELAGGQAELELIHRSIHHLPGPWSRSMIEGALGTLVSPSRGLFIYTPWVALALAATPLVASRLASHRLIFWLLLALIPYFLLLSKYAVWWGGHCFGPRYWTDVIPLFAILLAFELDWAVDRSRVLIVLFAITIALAIGVQLIGAYCFPSSWNLKPVDVDARHERLWDWRDNELSRCLVETWRQYSK